MPLRQKVIYTGLDYRVDSSENLASFVPDVLFCASIILRGIPPDIYKYHKIRIF